jgi:hypothetical protein
MLWRGHAGDPVCDDFIRTPNFSRQKKMAGKRQKHKPAMSFLPFQKNYEIAVATANHQRKYRSHKALSIYKMIERVAVWVMRSSVRWCSFLHRR